MSTNVDELDERTMRLMRLARSVSDTTNRRDSRRPLRNHDASIDVNVVLRHALAHHA
jgi:hypothetical protein